MQTTFAGTYANPAAATLQRNGAIVVAGVTQAGDGNIATVVRYRPNGSLDPSFGKGGVVKTAYAKGFQVEAVTVQADRKIVVAGASFDASFNAYPTLARYRANGTLDSGFGTGGIVQAPLAVGRDAAAVLVQRDGKIVVGITSNGIAVARYAPDGKSLDSSFDGDGVAHVPGDEGGCGTSSESGTNGVLIAPGPAILARGPCGGASMTDPEPTGGMLRFRGGATPNDGAFDTTFGSGGATLAPFPRPAFATGLARLGDGRLVQADQLGSADSNAGVGLFRTNANGKLDPGFGTNGSVSFKIGGFANSAPVGLAVAPNGDLVVAAYDGDDHGAFAVARRTLRGAPDVRYASGGQASLRIGPSGPGFMSSSGAVALVLQSDDRPVVVGTTYKNNHRAFTLVRFRAPLDRITRLKIKPATILAAAKGPPVTATKKHALGGIVTYVGTEPATTTTFTVQRSAGPGRVQGGRCVGLSQKNRHHKRCTRYSNLGSFKHSDVVGLNRFRFTGRVHGHTLQPGRYRLRAVPRNSGGSGAPAYVGFHVRSR